MAAAQLSVSLPTAAAGGGGGGKSSAPSTPSKTPEHTIAVGSGGASSAAGAAAAVAPRNDIRIALICQSNLNRSMEAHFMLANKGFAVSSFGAGTKVRLPGEAQNKPNIYEFGTPYDAIYNDLKTKNAARYTKTGMLKMVDRNRKIKIEPERWQDNSAFYDLVICYEKRVYETVTNDIEARSTASGTGTGSGGGGSGSGVGRCRPVHVINLDTTDNHTEAHNSAVLTVQLVTRISTAKDWEDEITEIIDTYEKKNKKSVLHTVLFY